MPIKVLIVDDSAVVRSVLSRELAKDPQITVVGTAEDPLVASDKIEKLSPDVLTLDISMPHMDGITFLRALMKHHPMPVIVVSALTVQGGRLAMEALATGAVDIVTKPGQSHGVGEMAQELAAKIKAIAGARVRHAEDLPRAPQVKVRPTGPASDKIIAMGASTGGTQALQTVLTQLPANIPPILVVQHMPEGFTRAFADRLNGLCPFEVKEAAEGDTVDRGRVLIAAGNFHMILAKMGPRFLVHVQDGPKVHHQRPSVEVLFQSVAQVAAGRAIGVMLTGMGGDGAEGMAAMKKAGAYNIAQDEATSVVFGMPKEAIRLGGVDQVLPLDRVSDALIKKF